MKKKILVIALLMLMTALFCLPTFATAALPRVVDDADLLTDAEEQALETQIAEVITKNNFDVVIVTTNDSEGKSAMAYADDYFDYNGYGCGENRDGVLLAVCMDQREVWISGRGYGVDVFDSASIESTLDAIWDDFTSENYYNAFSTYISEADSLYYSTKNATKTFVITALFVISWLFFIIIPNVWKHAHKSAIIKTEAGDYVVRDSLNLAVANDVFTHSSVTRVKIEKESNNNNTHTSSSGATHSGGGRSF